MLIKENLGKELAEKIPYLKMLILFGSQARGDIHSKSDWDFAAFYDQEMREKHCEKSAFNWFEVPAILAAIFNLDSDNIDVVELNTCSDFIAHYIARDGILLYEKNQEEFDKFKQNKLKTEVQMKQVTQTMRNKIEGFLVRRGV